MNAKKIVLDTDILLDHLTHSDNAREMRRSVMRRLMTDYFCYTTVFNAIEMFSLCKTKAEVEAVEHSMNAVKILGMNSKNARRIGPLLSDARSKRMRDFDILVAGLCMESKLPLVTSSTNRYRSMKQLHVVSAQQLLKHQRSTSRP